VLVLGGIVGWVVLRDGGATETEPAAVEAPAVTAPPSPAAPTPAPVRPRPAPPPIEEEHVADDGLPFMPAAPDAARPTGPVHPHPITPQHQRIYAENRLIGALNGAMDVRDVAGMRKLLKQYRDEYPEDANDVQEGYEVVADCFEHPGAEARAAAVRFGEEHRGSTLRRWVNRYCLDGQ
jgi:hypothetical protein